jgi:hypothetical protein
MQRIVKRFLLHKQRESDEVGEADFDELKQDLQMVRFEMLNDLKRQHNETLNVVANMQAGLILMGDELFKDSKSESALKFRELKNAELELLESLGDAKIDVDNNVTGAAFSSVGHRASLGNKHDYSVSVDSGLHQLRDHASTATLACTRSIILEERHHAHNQAPTSSNHQDHQQHHMHSNESSLGSSFDNQSEHNTESVRLSNSEQDLASIGSNSMMTLTTPADSSDGHNNNNNNNNNNK